MPLKLPNGGEKSEGGNNRRHAKKKEDERRKGTEGREEGYEKGGTGETIATKEKLGGRWGAY